MLGFPFQVFKGLKPKQRDCGSMTQQQLHAERFGWSNRSAISVENNFQNDNRNDERDRNNEHEYIHSSDESRDEKTQDDCGNRNNGFGRFHPSDDCRDDEFQRQADLFYETELRERSSPPSVPGAINMGNYASRSNVYERSTLHHKNNNDSREIPKVIIKSISKGWIPKEERTIATSITSSSRFSNQEVWVHSTSEAIISECAERLYNRSQKLQTDGKKRREAIAQAIMQKQISRTPKDYGTLPVSKATDVYVRGIRSLNKKEARLEEKRRRNSKNGSINRRDSRLDSNNSQEISGSQIFTSAKLPLSKASDMYERAMTLLIAKQSFLHRIRSVEVKHNRVKLPRSRAHDMYERAARDNLVKEAKLKQLLKVEEIGSREKLPLSRACDMYHRSLRGERTKHQKIEQRIALERKKDEEIRLSRLQEWRKRRKRMEMAKAIANYDSKKSDTSCIFSVRIPSKSKRVDFSDGTVTLITPSKYGKKPDGFQSPILVVDQEFGVEVMTGARPMIMKQPRNESDVPVKSETLDVDTVTTITTADTSFAEE